MNKQDLNNCKKVLTQLPSNKLQLLCQKYSTSDLNKLATEILNIKIARMENCSNPKDYITQDEWSAENKPIKIDFINFDDPSKTELICYEKDALLNWLQNSDHLFARWLPKVQGQQLNREGREGAPSSKQRYLTIYPYLYGIDKLDYSAMFTTDDEFIAVPIAKGVRLGNLAGLYTEIGAQHGQAPGYILYDITPKIIATPIEVLARRIFKELDMRSEEMPIGILLDPPEIIKEYFPCDEIYAEIIELIVDVMNDPNKDLFEKYQDLLEDSDFKELEGKAEYNSNYTNFNSGVNNVEDIDTANESLTALMRDLARDICENNAPTAPFEAILYHLYNEIPTEEFIIGALEDLPLKKLIDFSNFVIQQQAAYPDEYVNGKLKWTPEYRDDQDSESEEEYDSESESYESESDTYESESEAGSILGSNSESEERPVSGSGSLG